jgi:Leucine-rich repeat (LRR) protein
MPVIVSPSPISASVSGNSITASVSGGSGVAVSQSASQALSFPQGIQTPAPVQSVNGQIGNVVIPVTAWVPHKPPGVVWFASVLDSGSLSLSARSTTGYVAVQWWDGSVQAYGVGSTGQYIAASKAVLASGNWAQSSIKQVFVWSCVSAANATQSGSLTGFSCSSKKVFAISIDGCSSLLEVSCDSNQLTSLNLTGCAALQTISCHLNSLVELNVSDATSLTSLYCQGNGLRGLDVTRNTALQILSCSTNQLTVLDLSQNSALTGLYCFGNQLATLDVRNKPALRNVNVSSNSLSLVRAAGVVASGVVGMNVASNQLDATALNSLYTDLAAVQSGVIYVSGNPGVAGDNPAIAAAKGYTVNG